MKTLLNFSVFIFFALFTIIIILSNQFDWDHFLSFFEVDLRSWIIDFRPPLWTYQLCAGITRIGDPQAFGLSPIFLSIILFGSFWGSKIMLILSVALGYVFTAKILDLVFGADLERARLHRLLSLFFNFGGYFLWHYFVGHMTFSLMSFGMLPLYFFFKAVKSQFEMRDFFWSVLSSFCYLTAGFYHALVFFHLPVLIFVMAFLITGRIMGTVRLPTRRSILLFGGSVLIALILSSYKWLSVLQYQRERPRELGMGNYIAEPAFSIFDFFNFIFSPTFNFDFVIGFPGWGPWYIWEYASFSAIPILLIALLLQVSFKKGLSLNKLKITLPFFAASLVCLLYFAGDESFFSIHRLMNKFVYNNSVRVIGRYLLLLQFLFLFGLSYLLTSLSLSSRRLAALFYLGSVLTFLNLLSFLPMTSWVKTNEVLNYEISRLPKMTTLQFAKRRIAQLPRTFPVIRGESFMYEPVLRGQIVPNCYQPLKRGRLIVGELEYSDVIKPTPEGYLPLVDDMQLPPVSNECMRSSYVRQAKISWNLEHCRGAKLCFHLNDLSGQDKALLSINPELKKYCSLGH